MFAQSSLSAEHFNMSPRHLSFTHSVIIHISFILQLNFNVYLSSYKIRLLLQLKIKQTLPSDGEYKALNVWKMWERFDVLWLQILGKMSKPLQWRACSNLPRVSARRITPRLQAPSAIITLFGNEIHLWLLYPESRFPFEEPRCRSEYAGEEEICKPISGKFVKSWPFFFFFKSPILFSCLKVCKQVCVFFAR